jgi:hypothetical protein
MSGIVVKLGLVNGRITHEMIRIPHWSLNQQQQQQKIWLHFSHFSWKKKNFLNYWNSFAPDPFASAGGLLHAFKIGRRRWWSRSVRATFFFSSFKHAHDPKYIRLEGFVLSLSLRAKKKKKERRRRRIVWIEREMHKRSLSARLRFGKTPRRRKKNLFFLVCFMFIALTPVLVVCLCMLLLLRLCFLLFSSWPFSMCDVVFIFCFVFFLHGI